MKSKESVKLVGFLMVGGVAVVCDQTFTAQDGELLHFVDGKLRATVSREGFEAYAEEYPACEPVLAFILGESQEIVDESLEVSGDA